VAKPGLAKSAAHVLRVLTRVASAVSLLVAIAGAQEPAWPPSTPDGEPRIDYTRKILDCNANGCWITVVRSQEDLMQALIGTQKLPIVGGQEAPVTFKGQARIPIVQQHGVWGSKMGTVQQVRFSSGFHLILGGCFGGDLPATSALSSEESAEIQNEIEQRFTARMSQLRELQRLNSTPVPQTTASASATASVR
jgi:hypothetical protein